jgi:N-methylhydantoinase B
VEDEDYMDSTTVTMGGAGATWGRDGANLVGGPILLGGLLPPDPEVTEHLEPLRIDRLELRTDSAGDGRWRGGLGLDVEITAVGHEALFSLGGDFGQKRPPWGLLGGGEGSVVRVYTDTDDGTTEIDRSWQNLSLSDGETYRQESGGGGGVGDPLERDPERVSEDVRNGYVSRETATETYGVAFEGDSLDVDEERTAARRTGRTTTEQDDDRTDC